MDLDALKTMLKESPAINEVIEIALPKISRDVNQPRKFFDPDKLNELADDISQHGLLQPILVRKDETKLGEEHFIIVAGERRFAAFEKLGKEAIPAIVIPQEILSSCKHIGYLQMAENIKRDDLKFYEMSEFIAERVAAGESQVDIAKNLGLNRSLVNFYLYWKDAPDWLKDFKDHFRTIRTFYSFCQEAKTHPDELKSFLDSLADKEFFTNGDYLKFKDQLDQLVAPVEAEESELEAKNDKEISSVSDDFANLKDSNSSSDDSDDSGDGLGSPGSSTSSLTLKQNKGSISDYDANSDREVTGTGETGEEDNESHESQSQDLDEELSNDSNGKVEPDLTSSSSSSSSDSDSDSDSSDSDEDKLCNPKILGYVSDRKVNLLFTKKSDEGFAWVEYLENGEVDLILTEDFKLSRIIEDEDSEKV